MKNERSILRCEICGNIVGMIYDSGSKLRCCGQDMTLLQVNTVEAAVERHLPVATRIGKTLHVDVGSAPHPMTADHHIEWILLAEAQSTQRIHLNNTDAPTADFCVVDEGQITVYSYCNLHGLWAIEVDSLPVEDDKVCSADFSKGCS